MKTDRLITLCQRHQALLLNSDEQTIAIAVVDAPTPELMEALRFATQKRIDIECWSQAQMDKRQQTATHPSPPAHSDTAADIIGQVQQILEQALRQRASDIHFEPEENHLRIRLRVDGVLHALSPLPPERAAPVAARLKVLGNLDIAEHRLPQDGQFTLPLAGRPVSFRIATLPCRHGEKIVLRLLHQVEQALELGALGLSSDQLNAFRSALEQPQGLLLVTGPTGSGKTVTLYSALQTRNHDAVNICSVEDPLEMPIAGMNQTQINPRVGLTFQNVLRALLRQDPDIVMVGEIRDAETAEIAIKAAQTGHLVLSTLHTNSTSETLTRLQQMGVAGWMLSSALSLVIAQRLVRKLCVHCRRETGKTMDIPRRLWPRPLPRWQAVGCQHCYHGYYGRQALFELLPVNAPLRQAIARGPSALEIESLAREAGMMTLFESGCLAVEQGLTNLEEIVRVLGIPHDR
ncbi:type II secretion system protein GspE [Raoultella ornithinolytica]|uniref:type II secretion system protein GspE n=1 Tax=Raoultella ornithinolytica TaxID=54291 RepID=UPI001F32C53B|nr:type II secretion system protein GspE [Raoultella ornithinolytica]MCE9800730.1 type II secretion system protein GspE [Raoultella ornithinolytica]MCE9811960.1 type II secretion system protein GspE [Raoultella ornithinolytica]MCE9868055.1 type II secretion system protein GspE [Raoultella ornithinolytica]HCL6645886.1 type II secretion system protein GspE [Raoultella ornithinolytica]HEC2617309.1 type II secretion system protein GspE [Raoultella ornithinolytica]